MLAFQSFPDWMVAIAFLMGALAATLIANFSIWRADTHTHSRREWIAKFTDHVITLFGEIDILHSKDCESQETPKESIGRNTKKWHEAKGSAALTRKTIHWHLKSTLSLPSRLISHFDKLMKTAIETGDIAALEILGGEIVQYVARYGEMHRSYLASRRLLRMWVG